jgi:L-alanine-DL-glutamate epimerase-like enolase superfamily enzyme
VYTGNRSIRSGASVREGEIIDKGFIPIPEKPGLGVEMNEEAARKAQAPGTPWFEPSPARRPA